MGLFEALAVVAAVASAGLLVVMAGMVLPLNPSAPVRPLRLVIMTIALVSALLLLTWAITAIFDSTATFG